MQWELSIDDEFFMPVFSHSSIYSSNHQELAGQVAAFLERTQMLLEAGEWDRALVQKDASGKQLNTLQELLWFWVCNSQCPPTSPPTTTNKHYLSAQL